MQPSGLLVVGSAALLPFPDKFFHACVTSPPYWGLRKYAGEQQRVWGGDAECKHEWGQGILLLTDNKPTGKQSEGTLDRREKGKLPTSNFCQLCGAWRGALGLEPTPELHIEHMVEIFREVWRVLRPDGVVYLNYGDCYSAAGWECNRQSIIGSGSMNPEDRKSGKSPGFAAGNLMMMPHKVAIALQSDGWIVRNDAIWWKRNPMPESINGWRWERHRIKVGRSEADWDKRPKGWQAALGSHDAGSDSKGQYRNDDEQTVAEWIDCPGCEKCLHDNPQFPPLHVLKRGSWRHTRAHEYIFPLVKKMNYYSNQEAVRELGSKNKPWNEQSSWGGDKQDDLGHNIGGKLGKPANVSGRNPRSVLDVPTDSMDAFYHWLAERMGVDLYEAIELFRQEVTNPNDVLDVPTHSYKGAHYATYPENLIAPLIRASCPKRCCPECGAPWAPVVEKRDVHHKREPAHQPGNTPTKVDSTGWEPTTGSVIDYRPTCSCDCDDHIPGIVLDPFIGSGTTGAVARELGRRWVGLDISMEYLDQQAKVRTKFGQRTGQLDHLPLFEKFFNLEDIDK